MGTKSEKQLIFESVLGGKNRSVQLNVRISPELNEALEGESKRLNQPVSDLVRNAVALALVPRYFKNKLKESGGLSSDDQELLEAYRSHLLELSEACSSIDEAQDKQLREIRRHLKGFDKMLEKAVERAVERILARQKGPRAPGKR